MVQQQYNLVVRFIAVLLFCSMGGFAHEGVSHEENYFAACVTYLEGAKDSLESGGVSQLVSDGYKTYLEYPSGPYVFCFSQSAFSVDTIGESALVLHPFTANKTLDDLLDTSEEESLFLRDRKAQLISNALNNNRTLGELFNYTEPYSQEKSDAGGIRVDGEEKKLVGFVDRLGDGVVVQCGCRYTGVPDGERDNRNAIKSEGGAVSSMSGRASVHTVVGCFFLLLWFSF
ncbi:hypothetical protein M9434_006787 [Picochlorum sp. BPE23]|nr:hypothetical protein M9434_006787 [Picochlorum sp. BPE23]